MALTRRPEIGRGAVLVRTTIPLGAALVLLAGDHVVALPALALVAGTLLAMVQPATVGAWVAVPGAAWSFVVSTPTDVGAGRVVLAAAGVYLLHTGTAAAATCPLAARVGPEVARRWLVRCLPAVVLTAVVAALDGLLGRTPDNGAFLAAAGVLVVVAVAALVRLLAATRDG